MLSNLFLTKNREQGAKLNQNNYESESGANTTCDWEKQRLKRWRPKMLLTLVGILVGGSA